MNSILRKMAMIAIIAASAVAANAQTTQEAVYLKNGNVIRGVIIEQIPNETLKIQTTDGSVFVYRMSEVEKITKEQKTPDSNTACNHKTRLNEFTFDIAVGAANGEDIYGLSFNYARIIPLSDTNGLTLRPAIGEWAAYQNYGWGDVEVAFASLTPKLDFGYRITWANSSISLFPYIGLTTRINVWGRYYYHGDNCDIFDAEGFDASRFQIGGRLGFDAHFNKFVLGLTYEHDFNEIYSGANVWTANLKLGWCF